MVSKTQWCALVVVMLSMGMDTVQGRSRFRLLKAQIANCTSSFICNTGPLGPTCAMECVSRDVLCDGTRDCSTGADELDCPEPPPEPCISSQFICADNMTCVAADQICDGTDHCLEGEDEANCTFGCTCEPTEYQCENGEQCIPGSKLCDGVVDCMDTEDDEPRGCMCTYAEEEEPLACGPELPAGTKKRDRVLQQIDHQYIIFHSKDIDFETCVDVCKSTGLCRAVLTYVDDNDVFHCYMLSTQDLGTYTTAFDTDVAPGDDDCGTQFYPVTTCLR